MSVTASLASGVVPNYEVTFTVQLQHSKKSTSHAFRILLEIAMPHEYFQSNARIADVPAGGGITLIAGDQAPSGNSR